MTVWIYYSLGRVQAVVKCHAAISSHIIMIWVLGNLYTVTELPGTHGHVIAICSLLFWLPQKVNWESCKVLLTVERFPLTSMHGAREFSLSCRNRVQIIGIQASFLQLATGVPFHAWRAAVLLQWTARMKPGYWRYHFFVAHHTIFMYGGEAKSCGRLQNEI